MIYIDKNFIVKKYSLLIIAITLLFFQIYLNFVTENYFFYTDLSENNKCLESISDFKYNLDNKLNYMNIIFDVTYFILSSNIILSILFFYVLSFFQKKIYVCMSALYLIFVLDLTIPVRLLSLIEPMKSFYEFKPLFDYSDICADPQPIFLSMWLYFIFIIIVSNVCLFLFFNKGSYIK